LYRNFCVNKWLQVLLFQKLTVSFSKEIPYLLWNLNIPYLCLKCLLLDHVVSQINSFLTLTPHSFKNLVNIILQHTKIYIVVGQLFFGGGPIIMYYVFTKIRNLMLSDFTTMMYGSCLSTTQSTALLQKQLEKLYCNVHMQYFTLFLFFHYSFQTDILFHWCSAFAGMCQILPTTNIKLGRKLNVLLLVLMYV